MRVKKPYRKFSELPIPLRTYGTVKEVKIIPKNREGNNPVKSLMATFQYDKEGYKKAKCLRNPNLNTYGSNNANIGKSALLSDGKKQKPQLAQQQVLMADKNIGNSIKYFAFPL